MGANQLQGYPSDDVYNAIESIAEHHDISMSKAVCLVLEEGLAARSRRVAAARVELKLDRLIDNMGFDVDQEQIQREAEAQVNLGTPIGGIDTDQLADEPAPEVVEWVQGGRSE